MIHIATVHFNSERWIEIQRRYLDRFIGEPFRVYASLEGVPPQYARFFDVVVASYGPHAGKLNLLGRVIAQDAAPDDLIFFLDGDAFPIADPVAPVRDMLRTSALAAICRLENEGDRQPHPCFCAVPASVWSELPGDWSEGYPIRDNVTDVGANLLYQLESKQVPWTPILRTARHTLHPVLFGIYGDFLYHHGAGFRAFPVTRRDVAATSDAAVPRRGKPTVEPGPRMQQLLDQRGMTAEQVDDIAEGARRNAALSKQVFAQIESDPDFFEQLR